MPYLLKVFDREFSTEDLTVGEAETLEKELEVSWLLINPQVSIRHCRAVVAVFLAREMGWDAANEKIRAVNLNEMADGIEKVGDTRPTLWENGVPKAAGGPSTESSPSASSTTDGHPT